MKMYKINPDTEIKITAADLARGIIPDMESAIWMNWAGDKKEEARYTERYTAAIFALNAMGIRISPIYDVNGPGLPEGIKSVDGWRILVDFETLRGNFEKSKTEV